MKNIIKFSARSEMGRIRTNNEDNCYCNGIFMTVSERERPFFLNGNTDPPCVFAVCDGMGGEDCGELASLTAVETLAKFAKKIPVEKNSVSDFVNAANTRMIEIMKQQKIRMGTTLALAVINENSFTLYNIGDSRIYRLEAENQRLLRVTDDHSLAEDKVRMGLITPAQAEKDRDRHVLTRYLGIDDEEFSFAPDVYGPFDFNLNKKILLCSDGLTDMLSYGEISEIMRTNADVSEISDNLVDAALKNGGKDNVTCIVIEIKSQEEK